MKKTILSIAIALLAGVLPLFAQTSTELMAACHVECLTTDDFKQKIFNYDSNSREWKLQSDKPCVIDFYATWCGPCKKLAPIMEELAAEYCDTIYFYKVDTEIERNLAVFMNITSIPTLLLCPLEGQPKIWKGLLPKQDLKAFIDTFVLPKPAETETAPTNK